VLVLKTCREMETPIAHPTKKARLLSTKKSREDFP
jgi:hypothetical protein